MEVKILLWLLFATSFCFGNEIPGYIGRLIENLKLKETSKVHDVVLISFGTENKELTEKIAEVISMRNVLMTPPTGIIVKDQRIRAASVLIVVSSVIDEVKMILKVRNFESFINK